MSPIKPTLTSMLSEELLKIAIPEAAHRGRDTASCSGVNCKDCGPKAAVVVVDEKPVVEAKRTVYFYEATSKPQHLMVPNKLAKRLAELIVIAGNRPVRIRGGAGWGKSVLLRIIAEQTGQGYEATNFHAGTNIEQLVGLWHPVPTATGVTVAWEDGPLTRCIIKGWRFFGEEWSRLTPEPKARVMGLLDETNRYWPMPEKGGEAIEVHEDFQFITTENPHGKGYATQKEDPAVASRFALTLDVDEPLADEQKLLAGLFGGDDDAARRTLRWAEDCRKKQESMVSTRDIVQFAKLVTDGLTPMEAIRLSVLPKFPIGAQQVRDLALAHGFESYEAVKYG